MWYWSHLKASVNASSWCKLHCLLFDCFGWLMASKAIDRQGWESNVSRYRSIYRRSYLTMDKMEPSAGGVRILVIAVCSSSPEPLFHRDKQASDQKNGLTSINHSRQLCRCYRDTKQHTTTQDLWYDSCIFFYWFGHHIDVGYRRRPIQSAIQR